MWDTKQNMGEGEFEIVYIKQKKNRYHKGKKPFSSKLNLFSLENVT
jgi:hypothetical protein